MKVPGRAVSILHREYCSTFTHTIYGKQVLKLYERDRKRRNLGGGAEQGAERIKKLREFGAVSGLNLDILKNAALKYDIFWMENGMGFKEKKQVGERTSKGFAE